MRVIFMGTPEFGVPTLEALHRAGHQIVATYTQPDRPAGRRRELRPPPVKEAALRLGLTVVQPATLRSSEEANRIAGYRADAIIVAAYGLILPIAILETPLLGCLNLHPSLLPRYRGAAPIPAAILAGDEVTGVMIMLMNERLDAGPILAQQTVEIAAEDTAESLGRRLAQIGAGLMVATLESWAVGEISPILQDDSQATYTKPIKKSDGLIDWQLSASQIERRIRAYCPWPGAFSYWDGKMLKLSQAKALESVGAVRELPLLGIGEVSFNPDGKYLLVGTGEGTLAVSRLQLEGRKETPADEFIHGYRAIAGARLG